MTKTQPPVWSSGPCSNEILRIDDSSYISFQPDPWLMVEDTCETAIVVDDRACAMGHAYYILCGDWRHAYQEIAHEGLEACMALYRAKHAAFGHSASTRLPEERQS